MGAKLALFALAVQIILSWGHMHVHAAPAGQTGAAISSHSPAELDPQHRAGVPCGICAVMHVAGTALFATPPVLRLPDAARFTYRAIKSEFDHLDGISGAPQPRGPPAS